MKSTKKALFTSIVSLLLCVSMLVGTTFAWFTDSVTSGVNQIVAGNLDIDVLHTNATVTTPQSIAAQTNLFRDVNGNAMLWEPGAVSYENFSVKNIGTLAFKYNMSLNITDYNAVKDTDYTLKDVLKVKVLTGAEKLTAVTRDAVAALDWDTTDTLDVFKKDGGKLYPEGTADKDSAEDFQVIVYWEPTDTDNNWNVNNGKTTTDGEPLYIEFGINVVATQLEHEADSFDNTYDIDTMIPNLPTNINKTFESAPISGLTYEGIESISVVNKNAGGAAVASVPAAAVKSIVENLSGSVEDKKEGSDVSTVLYLSVETNEVGAGYASYEIDLTATMFYTDTSDEARTKELNAAQIDALLGDNIVTAEINIGKLLSDVTVKHNGAPMDSLNTSTENAVGFFYNPANGKLIIKTKAFSPFVVEYKVTERVATVTDANGNSVDYATFEDAVKFSNSGDTISLLSDVTISSALTNGYKVSGYDALYKVTIDGNGHKISMSSDMEYLTKFMYLSTIKNCDIEFLGHDEVILAEFIFDSMYENVDVYGDVNYTGNVGVYGYRFGNVVTLKNCTSYVNINGTAYNAVFAGYPFDVTTLNFENCVNKGNVVSQGAGMFIGNPTYNNYTVNITNCRNEGTIRQTTTNNTGYLHNPIFGITSDSAGGKTINIDGTTYTNYFAQYARMDIPFSHFGGGFSCGPEDSSFAISEDDNGQITITPAADSSVAYYVVYVGNQARLVAGGSSQICFSEKVVPAADGSLTVHLNGKYPFVDNVWVANHPDAVRTEQTVLAENGTEETYIVYTLNDASYYALDDETVDYSNHEPAENYRLIAYAYNANGQLLNSVGNFFKN